MSTMKQSEAKESRVLFTVVTLLYLFLLSLFFIIPNYFQDWAERAGVLCNLLGTVLILFSYVGVLRVNKSDFADRNPAAYGIAIVLTLALGIGVMCGFNFDFVGIAQRP